MGEFIEHFAVGISGFELDKIAGSETMRFAGEINVDERRAAMHSDERENKTALAWRYVMIRIDTYHAISQPMIDPREPALSIANCVAGAERWVDEIDGFGDQYFESAKPGRKLTFVIIPDASMPANLTEFEALPVVHASLLKVHGSKALITIDAVQPLGRWARECFLAGGLTIRSMPQWMRPSDELLGRLRNEKLIVKPPNEPWQAHDRRPWAAYLCNDQTNVERYLAIHANHEGCHLARVSAPMC